MGKALGILGWILSILASGIFLMGAVAQLSFDPERAAASAVRYPEWFHSFVGVAFLAALALHLIPRTAPAVLGAILMTAFFGGIIATHLVLDDGQWPSRVIMGLLPWLGLYLRDRQFNGLMSFWRQPGPPALPR
jgi:hypothetical protein